MVLAVACDLQSISNPHSCEKIIRLYLWRTLLFVKDIWIYFPITIIAAVLQGKISRAVGLMGVLKFANPPSQTAGGFLMTAGSSRLSFMSLFSALILCLFAPLIFVI